VRRFVIVGAVVLCAGCGGEDPVQHAARVAVQEHVHGARTRCTQTARLYLQQVRTDNFICVVDRPDDPRCDEYLAQRRGGRFVVRLRRREVDCALPAS
jgi:hypothetical protein